MRRLLIVVSLLILWPQGPPEHWTLYRTGYFRARGGAVWIPPIYCDFAEGPCLVGPRYMSYSVVDATDIVTRANGAALQIPAGR